MNVVKYGVINSIAHNEKVGITVNLTLFFVTSMQIADIRVQSSSMQCAGKCIQCT